MKSWNQLTQKARAASSPSDLDLRAAIRAEITSPPAPAARTATPGLIEDIASLFHVPWFLAGTATLAIIAFMACSDGLGVVNELALVWHLQGPVIPGI